MFVADDMAPRRRVGFEVHVELKSLQCSARSTSHPDSAASGSTLLSTQNVELFPTRLHTAVARPVRPIHYNDRCCHIYKSVSAASVNQRAYLTFLHAPSNDVLTI